MAGNIHGTLNVADHELQSALKREIAEALANWNNPDTVTMVNVRFSPGGNLTGTASFRNAGMLQFTQIRQEGPGVWFYEIQLPL